MQPPTTNQELSSLWRHAGKELPLTWRAQYKNWLISKVCHRSSMKEGEIIFFHRSVTFIIVPKSVLISGFFSPTDSPNEYITVAQSSDVTLAMSFPDGLTSCMYRMRRFCLRYLIWAWAVTVLIGGRYLLCMLLVRAVENVIDGFLKLIVSKIILHQAPQYHREGGRWYVFLMCFCGNY